MECRFGGGSFSDDAKQCPGEHIPVRSALYLSSSNIIRREAKDCVLKKILTPTKWWRRIPSILSSSVVAVRQWLRFWGMKVVHRFFILLSVLREPNAKECFISEKEDIEEMYCWMFRQKKRQYSDELRLLKGHNTLIVVLKLN